MSGVLERILYALLLAGILGAAAWISFSRFVLGKAEEVPDLTGRSVDEATALAAERGLRVVVDPSQEAFDEEIPAHRIRGQSPVAGMAVKAGPDLRVFLSLGPEIVRTPDLAGFRLPKEHEEFLLGLRLFHREADYVFVHAGIDPRELGSRDADYALRRSRIEDLLWNRTVGESAHGLGVTIVYGHTPGEDLGVRWNPPFSIGIDTGAVFGGPLTAIRLPDEQVFQAA